MIDDHNGNVVYGMDGMGKEKNILWEIITFQVGK